MKLNRRQFCCTTLVGAVASSATSLNPSLFAKDEENSIPIIDTHTHFYDTTRPEGVPFPSKDDKVLYRPVLPKEFKELTRPFGVAGTVVVEASPWVEDNQWLLELAEKDPFVVGVVGNLTPGTNEFAAHLARFSKNPLYRGIRINSDPLAAGLDRPEYVKDLARLIDADLELDILGGPEMFPVVNRLADRLPQLRIVINHLTNFRNYGKRPPDAWIAGAHAVAKHPLVYMKVSALVENAKVDAPERNDPEFYKPLLQEAWNAFGEDRLFYGSNWPVSDFGGPYRVVIQIVKEFWKDRGHQAARKFFHDNALAAYKWPKR